MEYIGPVSALYEVMFTRRASLSENDKYLNLRLKEYVELKRFGFQFDPRAKYPFVKDWIYKTPQPFNTRMNTSGEPNIIIFFAEGYSARAIQPYGAKYNDLTPHINSFAKTSMVVKNYYNHTAATYRGVHGQLCSLYPEFEGMSWVNYYDSLSKRHYLCLNNILEKEGYDTIFLDSHHEKHQSVLDKMLGNLGFSQVYTGDVLASRYLNDQNPQDLNTYSDKQYLETTISFLKERAAKEENEQPFLMVLYNFGTHAMLQMSKDGKKYGDGRNNTLNTIHTFDSAFGKFWDYFQKSPYAENTIIIFTADHCHYPEKPFVEAFDEPGYQPYFVDEIPFIVHDPTRVLPAEYNANFSTSIDFTPTLVHYLGLANRANPFMGMSLFEHENKEYSGLGVSYFGPTDLYIVDNEKIHRLNFSEKYKEKLNVLQKFAFITKYLDITGRIWSREIENKE